MCVALIMTNLNLFSTIYNLLIINSLFNILFGNVIKMSRKALQQRNCLIGSALFGFT